MTWKEFIYRLWFTREDDLDALQFLFTIIVVVSLGVCIYLIGPGVNPEIAKEVLVTLRWMLGLLVVTAIPKWLVPYFKPPLDKEDTPE